MEIIKSVIKGDNSLCFEGGGRRLKHKFIDQINQGDTTLKGFRLI